MIRISKLTEVSDYAKQLDANLTGLNELNELFSLLDSYGFEEYLEFDFSIVRGLAYYTGTVFELFDAAKGLRAIAGGGRYDHLIQHLANGNTSDKSKVTISKEAVGLGFGDVVILELLKDQNKLPELKSELDFYLLPFDEEDVIFLMPILRELRKNGLSAQMHYPPQKPRKCLQELINLMLNMLLSLALWKEIQALSNGKTLEPEMKVYCISKK